MAKIDYSLGRGKLDDDIKKSMKKWDDDIKKEINKWDEAYKKVFVEHEEMRDGKMDRNKIDTLEKFRKWIEAVKTTTSTKVAFLSQSEIDGILSAFSSAEVLDSTTEKYRIQGVDVYRYEERFDSVMFVQKSFEPDEEVETCRVRGEFSRKTRYDASLVYPDSQCFDFPDVNNQPESLYRLIESYYRIKSGVIFKVESVQIQHDHDESQTRIFFSAVDISHEVLGNNEFPAPETAQQTGKSVKSREEILSSLEDGNTIFLHKGDKLHVLEPETTTELTTRTWQEKLPNGEVVDVVELLNSEFPKDKKSYDNFWSGIAEKTIVIIGKEIWGISNLVPENVIVFSREKKIDLMVGRYERVVYSFEEALERMATL